MKHLRARMCCFVLCLSCSGETALIKECPSRLIVVLVFPPRPLRAFFFGRENEKETKLTGFRGTDRQAGGRAGRVTWLGKLKEIDELGCHKAFFWRGYECGVLHHHVSSGVSGLRVAFLLVVRKECLPYSVRSRGPISHVGFFLFRPQPYTLSSRSHHSCVKFYLLFLFLLSFRFPIWLTLLCLLCSPPRVAGLPGCRCR
ncbi:hypothetical protein CSUI_000130 [Cystoisospora suis]|uniref:Transmembrane protein n=1 Tax=Cystoisospora suis TaxID=483139 RepID=A0A2C6LHK8_9APIC|nr:hypothetical protein CSUI_000130 [Cystoisospora suis]